MNTRVALRAIGAMALALAPGAAGAQSGDPISNPRQTVANFDPATLLPILQELGVTASIEQGSNGKNFVGAQYGNFRFTIHPEACRGPGGTSACIGGFALATFTGYTPNPQSIAAFDAKYAFSEAGIFSDGSTAYVGRYDIADYGIARGNIASSLGNFIGQANEFWAFLDSEKRTVSLDGYADDLAAAGLNRRQAEAMGVSFGAAEPTPHWIATEKVIEFARDSVAAGADNRKPDKLRN